MRSAAWLQALPSRALAACATPAGWLVGVGAGVQAASRLTPSLLGLPPPAGSTAGAIQALDYLTMLKTKKGLNIVASSNSWGCGAACYSQALADAITRGGSAGILVRASGGKP